MLAMWWLEAQLLQDISFYGQTDRQAGLDARTAEKQRHETSLTAGMASSRSHLAFLFFLSAEKLQTDRRQLMLTSESEHHWWPSGPQRASVHQLCASGPLHPHLTQGEALTWLGPGTSYNPAHRRSGRAQETTWRRGWGGPSSSGERCTSFF